MIIISADGVRVEEHAIHPHRLDDSSGYRRQLSVAAPDPGHSEESLRSNIFKKSPISSNLMIVDCRC